MSTTPNPPVPVEDAVLMTEYWRDYYAFITGTDPMDAFRAFKIPLEDLQRMIDLAKTDPTIDSVRAYLALGEASGNQIIDPNTLHVLLVPVSGTTPNGVDVLQVQRGPTMISTIMDFTQPCPTYCDVTSPLYSVLSEE
jgi:hypothetical protein